MASATPRPGLQHPMKGCSKIGEYEMMQKLGEGTFGEVHKARHRKTGSVYALKKILMHNEKDGFPITALREIKLLKMLSHDNVLKLEEMAVERPKAEGRKRAILYMVTPYMDHDLSGLLDNPDVKFSEPQIKCYMLQLFKGLRYLHDNHILHRDMKAANLLINNRGRLQIADFGLARHYDETPPQRGKGNGTATREYTTLVVTRWYRPPELLLQLRRYTPAIDMWGAGCVFGEMFKRKPILAGNSDIHQATIIFDLVGTPNDQTMPGWDELPGAEAVVKGYPKGTGNIAQVFRELSPTGLSLIKELMKLNWRTRINAIDAIDHPYFKESPKPMREEDIPHFADSHELDRRTARGKQQALPPAPAGGTVGGGPNGEWTGQGPPPHAWQNGDRRYGGPQDRGPPGVDRPPRGYDRRPGPYDHRPPPPPPPEGRRPNWGNGAPPAGDGRNSLQPPRYAQDRRPQQPGGDVYIPTYNENGPRRSREPDERPRRGSRDSGNSREGPQDGGRAYRDRDRQSENRNLGRRDGRTRSRSPERRDRRDRDADIYRRR
ncbi:Pkinase-domain-containing protein [Dothidotthia symphoricarpi CBS 119687]|uniref:Serine/threonine-protein kinase BUR1 n=1 Tax=Dothidotthia symphoricarpi CBS 119687 TaxID=1392245 RepID=A0A6A6A983_9PLEO|nr:Pkinase-domain-containing protein [Dothidotthia symphoricarpi CBS 119687]KAF2128370.1 Pkinase-domain-containing protein [Dothidotthia symphoricarpi CBS 119687]